MAPRAPLADTTLRKDYAENRTINPRADKRPYFLDDDYAENERKALARRERDDRSHQRRPSPSDDQAGTVWTVESERDIDKPRRRSSSHIEPVRTRSILREKVRSPTRESLVEDVDLIWNPASSRDTTIHLELDIEDDLEGHLEEFSRLARLGHFKAAEQQYEQHLIDHIKLEPVLLECMDMLLSRGDYTANAFPQGPPPSDPPPSGALPGPAEDYGMSTDDYRGSGSGDRGTLALEITQLGDIGDDRSASRMLQERITRANIGVKLRFICQGYNHKGLLRQALDFAMSDEFLEYTSMRRNDSDIPLCSSDVSSSGVFVTLSNEVC